MNSKVQSALEWLQQSIDGPYCWCGASQGHQLSNCNECGQKFDTESLRRGDLMHRWRRRPVRESLKAQRERDKKLVMFGNWRYMKSWPDKPSWNDFKFEDFEEACDLFEGQP
jgi:hypothetical protein